MKKIKFVIFFMVIINIIVIGRLIYINVYRGDYYRDLLESTTNKVVLGYSAPRGRIIDAKGNILVDNVGVKVLIFNKLPNISSQEELDIASQLGSVLDLNIEVEKDVLQEYYYLVHKDEVDALVDNSVHEQYSKRQMSSDEYMEYKYSLIDDDLLAAIDKDAAYIYNVMNRGYIYQDKIIASNLSDEEFTLINELSLPGVRVDIRWMRKYNYETCLNELFGSVGNIAREDVSEYLDKGYKLDDIVGVSFLEKYYEEYLRGEKAEYRVLEDNTLEKVVEEKRGNDLVLSIDIETQLAIESVMKSEMEKAKKYPSSKYYNGSYVIVNRPSDGTIVALVAMNYDDASYSSDVIGLLTNSYTVGSVVKGASQTVAYKYGAIDENTKVVDSCIKLYSQNEKCSWKSLGTLNDIDALAYSSNYFQFLSAIKVSGYKYTRNMKFEPTIEDFNKYRDIFKSYGLGELTGIDVYEEQKGITGSTITGDLLLNLSIGQYDTYTPLMLSQYIATIANGGERNRLRIANTIIDYEGNSTVINDKEVLNNVDIEGKYMERIQKGFIKVATSGTGASYVSKKYKAAAKTGTSETYVGNVKTTTKSFIMYAPYDNPEYSIVMISPNIGYENSISSYTYPINMYLSRQITDILFEK